MNNQHPNNMTADRMADLASRRFREITAMNDQKFMLRLKQGVWAYLLLLLFEGALRKWFLTPLATPLLVVRDPIALWLILMCWHRRLFIPSYALPLMTIIGVLGLVFAVTVGHGNPYVAVFGARILLIHFPMIFVIQGLFTRKDVIQVGKFMVALSIPMLILIALQFYSPQSAWVNRGVGGDEGGAGFSGAMGYFRPPGTFSFTNGTTLFFSLLGPYLLYFWLNPDGIKRWVLIGGTIALLMAIPLSISRALLFQTIIGVMFCMFAGSSNPKYAGKLFGALFGLVVLILILSQTSIVGGAIEVFMARFENANESEGGMEGVFIDRFLGGLVGAFNTTSALPLWGYGIGMGTNVGSMLLTGGVTFLIAEGEWGRTIGELGPILGLGVVFIRMGMAINMGWLSFDRLRRTGDMLAWMLFSDAFLLVAQGQWGQPTGLGFCVFIGGLLLASLREDEVEEVVATVAEEEEKPVEQQKIYYHN
ncbi:hypothetical protein [Chitinophaga pinensis]|uniref:Uncharacterized protein n=1 Tax=Chitinophaga pinensis (strain ATCC 43595 / DSM 2588 / LMG 13176 / NBRC 15968 / NCIMB 11800 / UQM 2034) TaxID=485918 RepID=A0A979G2W3_CHIPD|nr:hypothetical protein [Chitinophaga pinensis]ACU59860.1 hypothetical protein Cpin_2369 [Chitinophaga pinensis DSM 2588]